MKKNEMKKTLKRTCLSFVFVFWGVERWGEGTRGQPRSFEFVFLLFILLRAQRDKGTSPRGDRQFKKNGTFSSAGERGRGGCSSRGSLRARNYGGSSSSAIAVKVVFDVLRQSRKGRFGDERRRSLCCFGSCRCCGCCCFRRRRCWSCGFLRLSALVSFRFRRHGDEAPAPDPAAPLCLAGVAAVPFRASRRRRPRPSRRRCCRAFSAVGGEGRRPGRGGGGRVRQQLPARDAGLVPRASAAVAIDQHGGLGEVDAADPVFYIFFSVSFLSVFEGAFRERERRE